MSKVHIFGTIRFVHMQLSAVASRFLPGVEEHGNEGPILAWRVPLPPSYSSSFFPGCGFSTATEVLRAGSVTRLEI